MVAPPLPDGSAAPLSEDRILACLAGYFPQTHPSLLLGRGDAVDTVWTCDFSHEYVTINADYRS